MALDPELVKQWKRGLEEVNRLDEEEQRAKTSEERLKQLERIWAMSKEMGLLDKPKPFDFELNETWNKIRRHYLAQQRPSPN